MNDDSRDYDVRKLGHLDDKRFTVIFREAVFSEVFFFVTIALEILVAYSLCPENMSLMTYMMGFPTWFFVATLVALVSWAFVLYHNAKLSRDVSLEARVKEDGDV